MRLVLVLMLSTVARAEVPNIQFSPLVIEAARVGDAQGWKVTAPVLSDGLTGRVCVVRFSLDQGRHHWEESRKRPIQVPQWEETAFYKRSFLGSEFDPKQPIAVTFSIVDMVNQVELGSNSGSLQVEATPMLVVDSARVIHFGKVVYQGRVDLQPTFNRVQHGDKGKPFNHPKLPKRAKGYWREYIHPTDGVRGDGPQRLIVGQGGEIFYTPDFHKTFIQLQ